MLANRPLTPESIVSISTPGFGRLSAITLKDYIERYECRPFTYECSYFLQIGYEETRVGITKSTLTFLQESQFNIDPASFCFVLDDCFDNEKAGQIKALERWGSIDEHGSLPLEW